MLNLFQHPVWRPPYGGAWALKQVQGDGSREGAALSGSSFPRKRESSQAFEPGTGAAGAPAAAGMTGEGRRHLRCVEPKTKWRPASLPASTVPGSLVLPKGETAFPREVPAEALRPRSVPQVPSQDYC